MRRDGVDLLIGVPLVMSVVLLLVIKENFLLFHTLAEFFAIIIAILTGVIAWSTYPFTRNNYLMFLGCGYFWVGVVDLLHTLAYKGMPTMAGASPNLAVQFWLSARGMEAFILVVAPFFLSREFNRKIVFLGFAVLSFVALMLITSKNFPLGFIDGKGLTQFKVISEYIIILVIGVAIYHLWTKRSQLDSRVTQLMITSMVLTMVTELTFTFYVSIFDFSNIIGHIFKLISYWLVFIAIIHNTLREPFTVMARGASSFDAVPDATIVVDSAGIIRQVNKAACVLSGRRETELLGEESHGLFHYEMGIVEDCPVCNAVRNEEHLDFFEVKRPQSNDWFIYTISPFSDLNGMRGMVQVIRDITLLKLTEAELHQTQARMADLFKEQNAVTRALNDVLYMIDKQGKLAWWNEVLEKVTGMSKEQLKGKSATDFFVVEDREKIVGAINDCFKNGSSDVEAMFITTDSPRPYRFSAVLAKNDEGTVTGIAGVGQDVTERYAAAQALKESEERFQRAVTGSSDGIWDWNIETGEVYCSERFQELLGYTSEQGDYFEYENRLDDLIHPDDKTYADAARSAHLEKHVPYHIELRLKTRSGSYRWFLIRGQCIWDPHGKASRMSGSLTDITLRKQDEVELNHHRAHLSDLVEERTRLLALARDDALRANHTKSLFLANMSHELRTPLNSIIGFTTIIHDGMAGPVSDEQRRQLGMVQDSSRHLLALINDILDLSKIEAGKTEVSKERISIVMLVDELMNQMRPLAREKGLSLMTEMGELIDRVVTDYSKLRQVMTNLLGNAIKFTEQGQVTLRISKEKSTDLLIIITDTGIGIPANKLEDVFSAFKQLDEHSNRRFAGTGLGLTISRRFVELLGGRLEVTSEEGRGSSFSIRIPGCIL